MKKTVSGLQAAAEQVNDQTGPEIKAKVSANDLRVYDNDEDVVARYKTAEQISALVCILYSSQTQAVSNVNAMLADAPDKSE